ncbi:maleate cis-trans isomerase [Arthrobacter sp. STN4]|uniref:maleate cis-trans isomerase family protein n=1 Tax=Arthrobacter sp. STN4 TaxID=2923276 RepID=UPI00211A1242|nr:maleate cis-trans isomerase [Arthrobacter sp. STN4]MCQ9165874.1 maleate cis-trans isomerase [Arthrobacter sp. STN4]
MTTIGMLYPGHSAEDEYPYLESILSEDVYLPVVHTSVGGPDEITTHEVQALLDLGKTERLLSGATEIAVKHNPDAVMWACTSGSFVFGWDGAQQQAREIQEAIHVPASSTSLAFAAALQHLGISKVSVSATYPDDVSRHFVELLGHQGVEVLDLASHDIASGEDAGELDHDSVINLARSADAPNAQAVLIPDTALHTVRWINELESVLGKTVLTANQVTAWYGLQLAGRTVYSDQLGSLFRSSPKA